MSIYQLSDDLVFPDPHLGEENGLLAVGGDLSAARLILAYQSGIFPWFNPEDPILWWSPDPRFVLYVDDLKVSKSMKQVINRNQFEIKYDTAFAQVIKNCSTVSREGEQGSWITQEMQQAYCDLHRLGIAHSVEAWENGQLVGGLYGVSMGTIFFGESMFHTVSNASKACFIHLVGRIKEWGFNIIDSQLHTDHLESLGGIHISRAHYLDHVKLCLEQPTRKGSWTELS